MALRKYQKASRLDKTVITTGDGLILVNGKLGADPEDPTDEGGTVSVNVGVTTTGLPNTDAIVENSGDSTDVVLNFTIPRGQKGDKGDDGLTPNFTVSAETMNSEQTAFAQISGTAPNFSILFGIPRGADGAGTIDVGTTTTLPAGSSAYVVNVGSSQNAVLNFGIPQGQDGGGGGYGIEEAPMDGTTYGRNNGSWVSVGSGGGGGYGIEEAPMDGGIYARQNGTWVQIG